MFSTVNILGDAATHAELEAMKGVSEEIRLGQLARIGTGAFDLVIDQKQCQAGVEMPRNMGTGITYDKRLSVLISFCWLLIN